MPLDPDHRQGGCFNPPWATTEELASSEGQGPVLM
jgi:hypothetical protein